MSEQDVTNTRTEANSDTTIEAKLQRNLEEFREHINQMRDKGYALTIEEEDNVLAFIPRWSRQEDGEPSLDFVVVNGQDGRIMLLGNANTNPAKIVRNKGLSREEPLSEVFPETGRVAWSRVTLTNGDVNHRSFLNRAIDHLGPETENGGWQLRLPENSTQCLLDALRQRKEAIQTGTLNTITELNTALNDADL